MEGYEQLCRVRGTIGEPARCAGSASAGTRGATRTGTRSRSRARSARWFDDGTGVALADRPPDQGRPPRRRGDLGRDCSTPSARCSVDELAPLDHDRRGRPPDPRRPRAVGRARTTTTRYRGVGEVLAGSTLELGALRLDVAFFRWHIEGRTGDRPLRHHPARVIKAVVSDFGGVVTLPLIEAFTRAHEEIGIPLDALGTAMELAAARDGRAAAVHARARPDDRARVHRRACRRRSPRCSAARSTLDGYGERLMGELRAQRAAARLLPRAARRARHPARDPDQQRARVAAALAPAAARSTSCSSSSSTPASRACRKPEPEIYALTLERLGLPGEACAFVDDVEVNVTAARDAGMHGDPLPRHRPGDRGTATR